MFSKIVLASNNAGKLQEFKHLLADTAIEIIPQGQLGVGDAIEDGLSFVENAILKARYACRETQLPAIADDSGLEVDALNGEPGIYSARYSGEHGNDKKNNQRLLEKLVGVPHEKRTARFQCVLAFMRHEQDPTPLVCQASWEGYILEQERGENGFGYDPLFWVPDKNCSSAELEKSEKNKISHRGQALQLFWAAYKQKYSA
jgi:XTP/dITP diphosphohydrolase